MTTPMLIQNAIASLRVMGRLQKIVLRFMVLSSRNWMGYGWAEPTLGRRLRPVR